jgi:hypothetical protein
MKQYLNSIIIGITVIIAGYALSSTLAKRVKADDSITVTGLGSTNFKADLAIWSAGISALQLDLKEAYAVLAAKKEKVKSYLINKGIKEQQITSSSITIDKGFKNVFDGNGNQIGSEFIGYDLKQTIRIESHDVTRIENISREISELIHSGIEITTFEPEYYYTKLADLKLEMISKATEDAYKRAKKVAEHAGSSLGNLKSASTGVFQIIGQNTNEEYEFGGSFNTASIRKTATVTVRLSYNIE